MATIGKGAPNSGSCGIATGAIAPEGAWPITRPRWATWNGYDPFNTDPITVVELD
jgi:hypothetical protein